MEECQLCSPGADNIGADAVYASIEVIESHMHSFQRFAADNLLGDKLNLIVEYYHMITIPPTPRVR